MRVKVRVLKEREGGLQEMEGGRGEGVAREEGFGDTREGEQEKRGIAREGRRKRRGAAMCVYLVCVSVCICVTMGQSIQIKNVKNVKM